MPSCGDSQCKQIASKLRRIEELNKQLADERDKADSKYRLLRTGHTINHRSCREKDCRAASEEPSRSPSMPVGPAPEMNRPTTSRAPASVVSERITLESAQILGPQRMQRRLAARSTVLEEEDEPMQDADAQEGDALSTVLNENRRGVAAPTGGFEDVQLNAADRQPTPGVTVSVLQTAPAVIARVLQPPPTVVAPVSQPAPAAGHGSLPRSLVSLVRNMEIVERNDDTSAVNAVGSAGGSGLPPADPNPPAGLVGVAAAGREDGAEEESLDEEPPARSVGRRQKRKARKPRKSNRKRTVRAASPEAPEPEEQEIAPPQIQHEGPARSPSTISSASNGRARATRSNRAGAAGPVIRNLSGIVAAVKQELDLDGKMDAMEERLNKKINDLKKDVTGLKKNVNKTLDSLGKKVDALGRKVDGLLKPRNRK